MNNLDFKAGTKNDAIFSANAPYSNPYQGTISRWLFVCSAGLLRSPTGASLAAKYNINARSCGSNLKYALIPCSANLVNWAETIIFVNPQNLWDVQDNFTEYTDLLTQITQKQIVLDIPDNFNYMDSHLVKHFQTQLFEAYGPVTTN